MGINNFDADDPRIQLEVMKERLKFSEEKIHQQEQALEKVYVNLGRQDTNLKRTVEERNELKVELEVTKQKLKHVQESLALSGKKSIKRNTTAKLQAFLASLLFLLASILASFGTNLLTSTPPNSLGWIMIVLAGVAYTIAALMTTLLALGDE